MCDRCETTLLTLAHVHHRRRPLRTLGWTPTTRERGDAVAMHGLTVGLMAAAVKTGTHTSEGWKPLEHRMPDRAVWLSVGWLLHDAPRPE